MVGWSIKEAPEAAWRLLAREVGISPLLARILVARGIVSPKEARDFLSPTLDSLFDPYLFRDMEKAVSRLVDAVLKREKILIYGDYDVDGITSCALLYHFLKHMGANVDAYIPDRLTEGYGISVERVREAKDKGVSLIVTVDCGVTSTEEAVWAKQNGIDFIITDHHNPGSQLPDAVAVIDPKVENCGYPFTELAGVGVAFKLVWAIAERLSGAQKNTPEFREFMLNSMALVALGTVADVVPLVGENRVMVRFGLRALEATRQVGLRTLLDATGLLNVPLEAHHISFRIAPRLNAAGRMGHAMVPFRLLCSYDTKEAYEMTKSLEEDNLERQRIEAEILQTVRRLLTHEQLSQPIIIFEGNWHSGVTGIVASRLANELSRPVVLIVTDGEMGKGTARSVDGCDIYQLLWECREFLRNFGGHPYAAGFEIHSNDISSFSAKLLDVARSRLGQKPPMRTYSVDAVVSFDELSVAVADELMRLEPFGEGNPHPVLLARKVTLHGGIKRTGKEKQNLHFFLRQGPLPIKSYIQGGGELEESFSRLVGAECDILFTPRVHRSGGVVSLDLEVYNVYLKDKSVIPDDYVPF